MQGFKTIKNKNNIKISLLWQDNQDEKIIFELNLNVFFYSFVFRKEAWEKAR